MNAQRCIELAVMNHLDHTARLVCTGQHREIWEVPSKDRRSVHTIVYVYSSHGLYCDCAAALAGQVNCSHKGAVVVAMDQRAEAYASAKRQTRIA